MVISLWGLPKVAKSFSPRRLRAKEAQKAKWHKFHKRPKRLKRTKRSIREKKAQRSLKGSKKHKMPKRARKTITYFSSAGMKAPLPPPRTTFVLFPGMSSMSCLAMSLVFPVALLFSTDTSHSQALLADLEYSDAGVACVTLVVVTMPRIQLLGAYLKTWTTSLRSRSLWGV